MHTQVIEVDRCTYDIDSIHFRDDPRLSPDDRDRMASSRGGSGLVDPRRSEYGSWTVTRDIRLGENVPGYGAR